MKQMVLSGNHCSFTLNLQSILKIYYMNKNSSAQQAIKFENMPVINMILHLLDAITTIIIQ